MRRGRSALLAELGGVRQLACGPPGPGRAVSTETFLLAEHLSALACISLRARKSFRVKAAAPPGERGFSSQNGPDAEAGTIKSTALRYTRAKRTQSRKARAPRQISRPV